MNSGKTQPQSSRPTCPDSPKQFFDAMQKYHLTWLIWAAEVDSCWKSQCGTPERKKELDRLCKAMMKWAEEAKKWGDDVEACFQAKCNRPPDHTVPPEPPFGS